MGGTVIATLDKLMTEDRVKGANKGLLYSIFFPILTFIDKGKNTVIPIVMTVIKRRVILS